MTLRIICAFVAAIFLTGCNQDAANTVAPPPVALNTTAMGVFCGMNLLEHPGPKGQIITASRVDPFWFTSVRDTVAFTLMADHGAGRELGESGRDKLDRSARGVFRDRKPQAGRNGRGRGRTLRKLRGG